MAHAQFKPWLFAELGLHLRFDSGMWMRIVVDDRGPQMHDYYLDRQRPDRITSYLEQELWRIDPFMQTAFVNGPSRAWAMSARDVPPGRLRDYLELHEQLHVVCSFQFESITRSFAGFSMFRRGRDDDFNEDERLFVEFVEPHLREAWTHNWLREVGATRPDKLPDGFAQGVFTAEHGVSAIEESFALLVRREWPEWHGPRLPAALIAHLRSEPRQPWAGERVTAYFGKLASGLTLVHLRGTHPIDHLPPSKRNVALLFASGTSQAEVARRLRLSPSTVNNYLVEIYRDLAVAEKSELAVLVAGLHPYAVRRAEGAVDY